MGARRKHTTNKKCMVKSAGSAIQHAHNYGAELTKLIDLKLVNRDAGLRNASLHERRRILSQVAETCQAGTSSRSIAKLSQAFRLAVPPCFISSHLTIGPLPTWCRAEGTVAD